MNQIVLQLSLMFQVSFLYQFSKGKKGDGRVIPKQLSQASGPMRMRSCNVLRESSDLEATIK
jgi:hypothetical protein